MTSIAFMTLTRDPNVAWLRQQAEYLRYVGDQFVIGIDDRTDPNALDFISQWPGTKVLPISWNDDFSAARNEILDNVEADFAAYFDPDELPNHQLAWFMRERVLENKAKPLGWLFWFQNFWGGRNVRMPGMESDWHLRMFRTDANPHFERSVHELVVLKGKHESETRGSDLVQKAPESAFVIHTKPEELLVADTAKYVEMERHGR